ncbi:ATP-binding cassette domain-containing protein [Gleimia hominis]|uniref:ATP-binding cassette domain-containing protein n=1 Tax=Gleimia hominis TaxID=595468 RepID=UPI000C7F85F5|nr:ATP-binding cassette domain-containing protein [Gleimia hominis]WIK63765.1 ATP-binding cassette domain-containing protein [Gleimia hominis]
MGVISMVKAQNRAAKQSKKLLITEGARRANRLVIALTWVSTAATCVVLVCVGKGVDALHSATAITGFTWGFAGLAVACIGVANICKQIVLHRSQTVEEARVQARIQTATFAHARGGCDQQAGRVVSLATQSAEKLMAYRQGFLPEIIASFTAPVLVLVAMGVAVSPLSGIVMAVFVPLVPLAVVGFEKFFSKTSHRSRRARGTLAAEYLDAIAGLVTLRLLGAAERVAKYLKRVGENNRRSTMRLLRGNQVLIFVVDIAFSLSIVTMATMLAAVQLTHGTISLGQGVTMLGLAMLLLEPIDHVGAFFYIGMAGMAAQKAIGRYLYERQNLYERQAADKAISDKNADDDRDANMVRGAGRFHNPGDPSADAAAPAVVLDHVSYTYPGRDSGVSDVSVTIETGQRVAFVGPSGGGKTTVLRLIANEVTPQSGRVAVQHATASANGANSGIRAAYVDQVTWLFTGTIGYNLKLANPQATTNQMLSALETVGLTGELAARTEADTVLDIRLGEGGLGLSSGQAQRLSLARAIVSECPLILLDEPTSQVDLESERKLLEAIQALTGEYTIIMATHRPQTLEIMDCIYQVENGRVEKSRVAASRGAGK